MEQFEIYKKLKLLRKERGLTLNSFAEKIGSDYQQLSRIERGKSKLSIDMLMKMANALDTPVAEIIEPEHAEPVKLKHPKVVKAQDNLSFSEELLTTVLGEIETALLRENITLEPSLKASVSSQVYKQAFRMYQEKENVDAVKSFISFCIGLIITLSR